jgi:hypothetical protein
VGGGEIERHTVLRGLPADRHHCRQFTRAQPRRHLYIDLVKTGAAKNPIGKDYMASPEHFFGPLDGAGAACKHEPQQDFTVPYALAHRANGYSGSGVCCWRETTIWSPQPHLCGNQFVLTQLFAALATSTSTKS